MTKPIQDEYTKEPDSRRRWMLRNMAQGNCRACKRPRKLGNAYFCEVHQAKHTEQAKRWFAKKVRPTKLGDVNLNGGEGK